jgi:hypothetical protein
MEVLFNLTNNKRVSVSLLVFVAFFKLA